MNEVAAVTRRVIECVLGGTIVPASIARAFESTRGGVSSILELTATSLRLYFARCILLEPLAGSSIVSLAATHCSGPPS